MQTSAMKTCFCIAECSLFYAKIMQTSAMKACFCIAECSLFYAKIMLLSHRVDVFAEKLVFLCLINVEETQ